jgi:curli production assembly/transport component CsgF
MSHRMFRAAACSLALASGWSHASELVYYPVNPNFGGAPNNGPGLLALASATNKHGLQSGLGGSSLNQTPLQQDGKLVPGSFTTEDFIITVTDLGGGILRVTTTEKATGIVTSFEVGQ